jgi:hypothetical protein
VPFRARGSIALRGTQVSRSVQFIAAEIVSEDGLAVDATSLSCADLYLRNLDAVGGVRFADARISGDTDLSGAYLRWNDEQVEALRRRDRPDPSIDGGAAEIGGDAWFDGARAEGLVRLRRATVRRAVGMRDVAYGAIAVYGADPSAATRDRALLTGEAVAAAAVAAARDAPDDPDAQRTARQARLAATAEAVEATRTAPTRRSRRAEAPEFSAGLLALDLAGLRTPDLVVAPARPLHGDVDLSRTVVISFTDNGNLWRARRLDLLGMEYQLHIDLDAEHGVADWATQIRRFESTKILPPPSTLHTDVALPAGQLSQPYLQLAATYRATGADSVARRILRPHQHVRGRAGRRPDRGAARLLRPFHPGALQHRPADPRGRPGPEVVLALSGQRDAGGGRRSPGLRLDPRHRGGHGGAGPGRPLRLTRPAQVRSST